MINLDDNDPDLEAHAARVRQALFALAGETPQDGDQPAGTRFADDLGRVAAIIDGWLTALGPAARDRAAGGYVRTAALLLLGPI